MMTAEGGRSMGFDPAQATEFRYVSAGFDRASSTASFHFALGGESFVETVAFTPPADDASVGWDRVDASLVLLGAVLSLSYYKAAAPPRFVIEADGMTDAALAYLRQVTKHGLAEFAYRSGLPALLEPALDRTGRPGETLEPRTLSGAPLVPIGGGKDSVVSVESLAVSGIAPVQFAVNPNAIIRRVAAVSGHPFVAASRTLDRRLLELNADGALNGHVPVTAMNSLIAVTQSLLLGLGPVVMSNEFSASDPTLQWNGAPVNHQWSKSLEAEQALAAVLVDQVGIVDSYFSLLRPFSEVRIARGYAQTAKYDAAIVSCNRAFRLGGATASWCGECDKCRFVFLAMAPFMSRERLTGIFGTDMFADAANVDGYRALLGLDAHKPFECVGEEAECSVAMSLASRHPDWGSSVVVAALLAEVPNLTTGDSALEEHVMRRDPGVPDLPEAFEMARRALL